MKLYVATPMREPYPHGETARNMFYLAKELTKRGIDCHWMMRFNEPYVHTARNALVHYAMIDKSMTHLLFLDSDVIFTTKNVLDLLAAKVGIIGGLYPRKMVDWESVKSQAGKMDAWHLEHTAAPSLIMSSTERVGSFEDLFKPFEVDALATGFMMIERGVFEKFAAFYPEARCKLRMPEGLTEVVEYFKFSKDEHGEMVGEDVFFCQEAQKMGVKIHVIPAMTTLGHAGTFIYKGCPWCATGAAIHVPREVKC